MVSSKSNEWATPQKLFDYLNQYFNFTLDPCATNKNKKCEKFYTKDDDGLSKSWAGEIVFMNPPYGGHTAEWLKKAEQEIIYSQCCHQDTAGGHEPNCPNNFRRIQEVKKEEWWIEKFNKFIVNTVTVSEQEMIDFISRITEESAKRERTKIIKMCLREHNEFMENTWLNYNGSKTCGEIFEEYIETLILRELRDCKLEFLCN